MNVKSSFALLVVLTIIFGFIIPAYAEDDYALNRLRSMQDQELIQLRAEYDRLGRPLVQTSPEYQELLSDYIAKRREIQQKYSGMDPRKKSIDAIVDNPEFKGRIQNTGSPPKNVYADVDLAATDVDAARELAENWASQPGKKKVQYYTIDNPRVPVTDPPKDFKRVYKVVNPNSDTTLWTPETEEIRRAKVKDPDAWTTSGGLKGTGNLESSRDKLGYYLDNEKKFNHADRPLSGPPGAHDEDMKTFAKSASKAGGSNGADIVDGNPEFFKQAHDLQNYGDDAAAGIAKLGDTNEIRQQKMGLWKQTGREEMIKAKAVSKQLSEMQDAARKDLIRQLREKGNHDFADQIEENRRKITDSNRAAAAENDRLWQESERIRNRGQGLDSPELAVSPNSQRSSTDVDADSASTADGTSGDSSSSSSGESSSAKDGTVNSNSTKGNATADSDKAKSLQSNSTDGGYGPGNQEQIVVSGGEAQQNRDLKAKRRSSDVGAGSSTGDLNAESAINKGTKDVAASDLPGDTRSTGRRRVADDVDLGAKKTSADVDFTADKSSVTRRPDADLDLPSRKRGIDVDSVIDAVGLAEGPAQVFQSGTRAAGRAIDENRDLRAGDALEVVKDMTPGVREYEGSKAYLQQRRLAGLRRQERIRQLEDKNSLSLDEELELQRLQRQEQQNPNTISSDLSSAVIDAEQHYQKRKEARKKAQGREGEKDSFIKDGIPMAVDIAIDGVNAVNPINQVGTPIAEGLYEVDSWKERQAWASQKDTLKKYVNSEAMKADKNSRRNTRLLSDLLETGDLDDSEVQKQVDDLLLAIEKDGEKLAKLNELADAHLQELDPKELEYLRRLQRGFPDVVSLRDWARQKKDEFKTVSSCPEHTVRLDQNDQQAACTPCADVKTIFTSAVESGDFAQAESFVFAAATCQWAESAGELIRRKRAEKECNENRPGSVPVFGDDSYVCQCARGEAILAATDEDGRSPCNSCEDLNNEFHEALSDAKQKGLAEDILTQSTGCSWVCKGAQKIEGCLTQCDALGRQYYAAVYQQEYANAQILLKRLKEKGCPFFERKELQVSVPDLIGLTISEANSKLKKSLLQMAVDHNGATPDREESNHIRKHSPGGGAGAGPGETVTVTLYRYDADAKPTPCASLKERYRKSMVSKNPELEVSKSILATADHLKCYWRDRAREHFAQSAAKYEQFKKEEKLQTEKLCRELYSDYKESMATEGRPVDFKKGKNVLELAKKCNWYERAQSHYAKSKEGFCQRYYQMYKKAMASQDNPPDFTEGKRILDKTKQCGWAERAHAHYTQSQKKYEQYQSVQEQQRISRYCEDLRGKFNIEIEKAQQTGNVSKLQFLLSSSQKCDWHGNGASMVACIEGEYKGLYAYNQGDTETASYWARWGKEKGCYYVGKLTSLVNNKKAQHSKQKYCDQLADKFNNALKRADQTMDASELKSILTSAGGCSWQKAASTALPCVEGEYNAVRSYNIGDLRSASSWTEWGRTNSCLYTDRLQGLISERMAQLQKQQAAKQQTQQRHTGESDPRAVGSNPQAPARRTATHPSSAPSCAEMNAMALAACQQNNMGSLDHFETRWNALGCQPNAALGACYDAWFDREFKPYEKALEQSLMRLRQ